MNDNKSFIINSLKKLEKNKKIKEIHYLSESFYCEQILKSPLRNEIEMALPILVPLYKEDDKEFLRKDKRDYSRYYSEPIILDGIRFLVLNHWTKDNMSSFKEWLEKILGDNSL